MSPTTSSDPLAAPPSSAVRQFRYRITGIEQTNAVGLAVTPGGDAILTTTRVQRIDLRMGEEVWRFEAPDGLLGDGTDAPPVTISRTTAFVGGLGTLFALDLESGDVRWKTEIGTPSAQGLFLSPPIVVPADGGRPELVVTADSTGVIIALDAATGSQLFSNDALARSSVVLPAFQAGPVTIEGGATAGPGILLVSGLLSLGDAPARANLAAIDVATFETVWTGPEGESVISSAPTLGNGSLYVTRSVDSRLRLEQYPLDALGSRPVSAIPISPVFPRGLSGLPIVSLSPQDGEVFFAASGGDLGIVLENGSVQAVDFGGSTPLTGPVAYRNDIGSRRALLAGALPPDSHAFFIVVALPIEGSPNFVQTEVDDFQQIGPLRVNESLFAVTYVQDLGAEEPGSLVAIDLTTI